MKPSQALAAHRAEIIQIVQMNNALKARVFGSVLQGEDTEQSDLDVLIDPTAETSLFDIGAIRYKLQQLLGVRVDVLTPDVLPESFRALVLAEAVPI